MPITTYDELKAAIQAWMDNDNPNVVAAIPDMIRLFEAEADRDLKTWERECLSTHPIVPTGTLDPDRGHYALPDDWTGARYVIRRADYVEMMYWRRLEKLSATVASNWLLDKHPDAYLFGSLVNSEAFLKNDKRIQLWGQAAAQLKEAIVITDQDDRYSGDSPRMRMDDDQWYRHSRSGEGRLKFMPVKEFHDMIVGDHSNRLNGGYAGWYTFSAGKLRIWPVPGKDPADAAGWSSCA